MKKYARAKSTKKKYARKRRFTKKRAAKRASLADTRFFKHKMTGLIPVVFEPNATQVTEVFARFLYGSTNPQGNTWRGIDQPTRWRQVFNNYQEYAVTGMALKYIPEGALPFTGQN